MNIRLLERSDFMSVRRYFAIRELDVLSRRTEIHSGVTFTFLATTATCQLRFVRRKKAQLASEHLIAVSRFLRTGDTEWLKPFVAKQVGGVELLTDPDRLRELAEAALIKLDALYRDNRPGRREH